MNKWYIHKRLNISGNEFYPFLPIARLHECYKLLIFCNKYKEKYPLLYTNISIYIINFNYKCMKKYSSYYDNLIYNYNNIIIDIPEKIEQEIDILFLNELERLYKKYKMKICRKYDLDINMPSDLLNSEIQTSIIDYINKEFLKNIEKFSLNSIKKNHIRKII